MRFDRWDTLSLGFGWGVFVAYDGAHWFGVIAIAAGLLGAFANARHDARKARKETP